MKVEGSWFIHVLMPFAASALTGRVRSGIVKIINRLGDKKVGK